MARLTLVEIAKSKLENVPIVSGQLIIITDTGEIYRDTSDTRINLGQDFIIVNELPLVPIPNRVYLLKPNKLYIYDSGWIPLNGTGNVTSIKTDETLKMSAEGVLSVNTATEVEKDNTLPITSAAVHTTVGNIEILLGTI